MKKKLITSLCTSICLVVVMLAATGEFFINNDLRNKHAAIDVEAELRDIAHDYPHTAHWIDSIRSTKALRDTFVNNRDGLRIHAYYLPSPDSTRHTAIIVHGYKSNALAMMHIGYLYHHELHYNILLPDLVAHGQSEGKWVGMGWNDRYDVMQWIQVANNIFTLSDIVVHGISMGAATTMCVSGEDTPANVRAFVEDCGYTSVWDEASNELKNRFSLPPFPLINIISLVSKLHLGWDFNEASPLRQVAKCTKPMFFIHGNSDTYVPTNMVHPLFAAQRGRKALWLAPGSEHANSYKDHPEEYTHRVKDFLEKD